MTSIRLVGAALVLPAISFFAFLFLAPPAHAQVCTPACGTGTYCAYTNVAETTTGCLKNLTCNGSDCTSDEFVVTAKKTSAPATPGTGFAGIVSKIVGIVNGAIIPLMYALAFLYFVYGIVRYFFIEGGAEGYEKAKNFALYGLLGLVVIFSVWGLVNLFLNTLTSFIGGTS